MGGIKLVIETSFCGLVSLLDRICVVLFLLYWRQKVYFLSEKVWRAITCDHALCTSFIDCHSALPLSVQHSKIIGMMINCLSFAKTCAVCAATYMNPHRNVLITCSIQIEFRRKGLWEDVLHWFPVLTEQKQIWRRCLCERCFKDRSDLFGEEYLVSIKT